jgi:hypothetical protein
MEGTFRLYKFCELKKICVENKHTFFLQRVAESFCNSQCRTGICDPLFKQQSCVCTYEIYTERMLPMITTEGLIAVISLVLTAFGLGYTIGSNVHKK